MADVTLNLEMAQRVTERALQKAREMELLVSVAVVDAGGHAKHVARMDGAGWFSPDIALGKAHAAAAFRRGTDEVLQRLEGTGGFPTALSSLSHGKMILVLGASVLVDEQDDVIGAVGVSGARGEDDQEVSRAAVDGFKL